MPGLRLDPEHGSAGGVDGACRTLGQAWWIDGSRRGRNGRFGRWKTRRLGVRGLGAATLEQIAPYFEFPEGRAPEAVKST